MEECKRRVSKSFMCMVASLFLFLPLLTIIPFTWNVGWVIGYVHVLKNYDFEQYTLSLKHGTINYEYERYDDIQMTATQIPYTHTFIPLPQPAKSEWFACTSKEILMRHIEDDGILGISTEYEHHHEENFGPIRTNYMFTSHVVQVDISWLLIPLATILLVTSHRLLNRRRITPGGFPVISDVK
jgi:hypothetical protein